MGTSSSGSIHQGLCLKHPIMSQWTMDSSHIGQVATHKGRWQNHPRPHRSVQNTTCKLFFLLFIANLSSASVSWTKCDGLGNPENLFEWFCMDIMGHDPNPLQRFRKYWCARQVLQKLPGTPATRALESRGPCNDAPAKQLAWSIPKFSGESRR